MNDFDMIELLARLTESHCELNHGPDTDNSDFPAVDYIVLPLGESKDGKTTVAREITIPVCAECAAALASNEWTLLYCFECGESRWVHRQLAKNKYRHSILWMRGCPECSAQFGGLYFSDPDNDEQGTGKLLLNAA